MLIGAHWVEIGLWLLAVGSALLVALGVVQTIAARDRQRIAAAQREHAELLRARDEARRPGAHPEHPIEVASPAAVEPRAEAAACPRCGGRAHVDEHVVHERPGDRLRRVRVVCGACGHPRDVFFRLRRAH